MAYTFPCIFYFGLLRSKLIIFDYEKANHLVFNSFLKDTSIKVVSAKPVKFEFDARFSAIKRYYKYRILCRAAPAGIDKGKVWHYRKKLNIKFQ